ncbi:hypothetical protein EVA24_06385 [bacterium]|nr:MAG: hypothetical protein EVA24_06385 [bacterium]
MIKKSRNRKSILVMFNMSLIIASIAIILNFSFSWAKLKNTFIEPEIILSGSIEYDQKSYIAHVTKITGEIANHLHSRKILEALMMHPFVQASRVSYRYPNKIIIELKEREAFAIINKDPLVILDRDCFVLPIDNNFNNYDIPILSKFNSDNNLYPIGEKSLSVKVQETILWLSSLYDQDPDFYSSISEVLLENGNEIVLILNEYPTKVLLGDTDTLQKIEILKKFEQTIKETKKITDYAYLDIRYNNQIIAKENK